MQREESRETVTLYSTCNKVITAELFGFYIKQRRGRSPRASDTTDNVNSVSIPSKKKLFTAFYSLTMHFHLCLKALVSN